MDKIVSLAKRRGFVFQSSEIYGGLNGCWDFGPLGVELLNNIKQAWWQAMTYRDDVEGIDASILMHPRVWEASGHVGGFSDPLAECRKCNTRIRVDKELEKIGVSADYLLSKRTKFYATYGKIYNGDDSKYMLSPAANCTTGAGAVSACSSALGTHGFDVGIAHTF